MTMTIGKSDHRDGRREDLGSCIAQLLSARKARIVLSDIDKAGVERRRDEINERGGDAVAHVTDVTQEDQVRDLMAFAVKECGGLDVLVNNAGLLGQEHQIQLADLETALWDRTDGRRIYAACSGEQIGDSISRSNAAGGSIIFAHARPRWRVSHVERLRRLERRRDRSARHRHLAGAMAEAHPEESRCRAG